MAEPVGALRVDVAGNSAMFAADMAKVRATVNSTAIQMQRAFLDVAQKANIAAASIMRMGSVAGIAASVGIAAVVKQSAQAGDEIAKSSKRIGVSAERFQELAYAASLAGVKQEEFATSMQKMMQRLGAVGKESEGIRNTLAKLGLKLEDLRRMKPDQAFTLLLDRIGKIKDPTMQAAAAVALFEEAGLKLIPLAKAGTSGLRAMAEEARRYGLVLSNETIKKTEEANQELDKIGKALRAAGINIAAGFLPAIQSIREIMTSQGFQDGIKTVAAEMGKFVEFLARNKDAIIAITAAWVTFKTTMAVSKNPLMSAGAGAAVGSLVFLSMRDDIQAAEHALDKLLAKRERIGGGKADVGIIPAELIKERANAVLRLEESFIGLQKVAERGEPSVTKFWQAMADQRAADLERIDRRIDGIKALDKEVVAAQQNLKALREQAGLAAEPVRLTVNKPAATGDPDLLADQEAARKMLDELTFKTRLARGEFSQFAEGFPEAARAAGLFGTNLKPAVTTIAELPQHLKDVNAEMDKLNQAKKIGEMMKGVADAIGKAFEDAIVEGKSLSEVLQALYKDLLRLLIRKMFTEPFGNFLTAAIPKMANGGPVRAGTMYEVGERGREMFVPRVDGRIVSNQELKSLPSGGGGITYAPVIDARGADVAAVARLERVQRAQFEELKKMQKGMASAQHHQASGVYR